jgi:hypothetical protein
MQTVDDKPETIHLYVVREEAPKPSLLPIFLSVVALSLVSAMLIAVSVLFPFQQPVTRAVIRVPAVPLAVKTFTAEVPVIPTGIKTYPATTAHGILTITNGSIIGQSIPSGFIVQGVATDSAVYVPAGSANGYSYATVRAHTLMSGKGGNLATLAINQVIGSSVYIRNLSAFSGGRDSYAVKVITAQDRSVATASARNMLLSLSMGLHYPCNEAVTMSKAAVSMSWRCRMLTYHIAAFYHVTGVRISGKYLIISVWFVARPTRVWVK